jgi:hypothetical protein
MSDAQGSAQAVLLKAWMANVRQIAGRSAHEIAQCPAPPARLTRDDCTAAGFRILGPTSACYHSDVFFQVNFSADFAHRAILIERRDGEPVCEQYPTWLDNRFVYAQVGSLWDHPLLDVSRETFLTCIPARKNIELNSIQ